MRFCGCFRQCNGKIPLKLNESPRFCRRNAVLAFLRFPCGIVLIKVYLPCRTWHGSGQSLCRAQPRKPAKNPDPALGKSLQTAGFGPQGSRPTDGFGGLWPPTAPRSGAGPAGPLPAQTYPTGIPRSIGCNCRPSSAAASAAPVRESSAARLVGFFRGSSCPKGTK